ncbi:sorbosone dehydrogenase family protein [Methylobacterium sp. 37f]|uniref:PQQ-dependent sugar dehydrogenase n=1 Tax=Methylobacterium sp. 37f TaxID=2817058 RepID=UPI001FFD09A4|nr:sorbosone dehydrogenase family protein [Methylobacterium sp. 37f]MCK2053733.1 sorbosone dehydrogenase family protein [Methylobacterium sp. 37f]
MRTGSKIGLAALAVVLLGGAAFVRFIVFPEQATLEASAGQGASPTLPAPNPTLMPTVNIARVARWENGAKPQAAAGLQVAAYAEGFDHPRWMALLPNGDVLVAEANKPQTDDPSTGIADWVADKVKSLAGAGVKSPDRIVLLRDANGDGVAEERHVFLKGLHSPFGMALVGNDLYVANADALVKVPYQPGQTEITATPETVVDLPSGINHHWTKNVIASPDGQRLYVTVGSNSNVGENGLDKEAGRAAIWEYTIATKQMREYATGLRNPNGLGFEPTTGTLWTVVNERDEIGSDLVPDYITSVREGGFYGWPYSYWGNHVDERVQPQKPELVAKAIAPDYAVGTHTASLGLAFSQASSLPEASKSGLPEASKSSLPEAWKTGLFVAQHGSWNRRPKSGYKVIYVPFRDGKPAGTPVDVLTGFLNADEKAQGRPVGVILDKTGALLVSDDVGKTIWRVSGASQTQ